MQNRKSVSLVKFPFQSPGNPPLAEGFTVHMFPPVIVGRIIIHTIYFATTITITMGLCIIVKPFKFSVSCKSHIRKLEAHANCKFIFKERVQNFVGQVCAANLWKISTIYMKMYCFVA